MHQVERFHPSRRGGFDIPSAISLPSQLIASPLPVNHPSDPRYYPWTQQLPAARSPRRSTGLCGTLSPSGSSFQCKVMATALFRPTKQLVAQTNEHHTFHLQRSSPPCPSTSKAIALTINADLRFRQSPMAQPYPLSGGGQNTSPGRSNALTAFCKSWFSRTA